LDCLRRSDYSMAKLLVRDYPDAVTPAVLKLAVRMNAVEIISLIVMESSRLEVAEQIVVASSLGHWQLVEKMAAWCPVDCDALSKTFDLVIRTCPPKHDSVLFELLTISTALRTSATEFLPNFVSSALNHRRRDVLVKLSVVFGAVEVVTALTKRGAGWMEVMAAMRDNCPVPVYIAYQAAQASSWDMVETLVPNLEPNAYHESNDRGDFSGLSLIAARAKRWSLVASIVNRSAVLVSRFANPSFKM
jgi:hypothetical protein